MKVISRVAILTAAVLVIAANFTPVSAVCPTANTIGGCSATCSYLYLGDASTNVNSGATGVNGNFWAWGGGNPAPGVGDDNGANLPQADPLGNNWVQGSPSYLAGAWATAGVDGCSEDPTLPTPHRTVVALSDQFNGKGYFAVLCQAADAGLNYDFSAPPASTLLPIPRPVVTSSAKAAGSVTLQLGAPSASGIAQAVYALNPGCTGLVRGYKICTSPQNSDLHAAAGWTCGSEVAIANATQATAPCAAGQLYVSTQLVFESGFSSVFVSEPRQVSCDPNMADRPGHGRQIHKPGGSNIERQ